MSSSSAYNNVLLKSPIQPQQSPVAKRDFSSEYSGADFSQAFNEARDNVKRKDEKPARPVADKKAGSAGRSDSTREAERHKKPVKEAHAPRKNTEADSVHSSREVAKDKSVGDKTLAKEKSSAYEKIEDKETKTVEATENSATPEVLPEPVITNASALTPAITTNVESKADVDTAVVGTITPLTNDSLTQPTKIDPSAASTAQGIAVANNLSSGNAIPVVDATSELNQLVDGVKTPSEITSVETNASATIIPVDSAAIENTNIPLGNENILPAVTDPTKLSSDANTAAVQTLTAGVPLSNAPKSATNVGVGGITETPEELLDTVTAEILVTDKTTAKASKEMIAPEAAVKTDPQAPVQDPKSVFEKMLQSVAKTSGRDESAPSLPLQNAPVSAASAANSAVESLVRFNDANTPAARSFVVQTAIPVPVGQPQWSQAVGEKVLWLAAQNVSSAEINLHPKDLGPMQVKVSVNQEQTSVSFTSHHPMVREVLDQNLNRLRDMFNEQGLNLVNVDVSDKSFSRQQGEGQQQKGQGSANGTVEEESVTAVSHIVQQRLVDHYA